MRRFFEYVGEITVIGAGLYGLCWFMGMVLEALGCG